MKPKQYFQKLKEKWRKRIQNIQELEMHIEDENRFVYAHVSGTYVEETCFLEEKSNRFLEKNPEMKTCAIVEKKESECVMEHRLYFQLNTCEYEFEVHINMNDLEEESGVITVEFYTQKDGQISLKLPPITESERKSCKNLLNQFQEWIEEIPSYRLQFATGMFRFSTKYVAEELC